MPKTVEADAQAALLQAETATGDSGPTRLAAIEQICTARVNIDPEEAFKQPQFIAEQALAPNISKASRAMMLTFEAEILKNIYQRASYKYDQVSAPLLPYPADISQWSGEQFRTRITELLTEALNDADSTPLSEYKDGVSFNDITLLYFPTVKDFVRYRSSLAYSQLNLKEGLANLIEEAIAEAQPSTYPYFYWTLEKVELREDTDDATRTAEIAIYEKNKDSEAARYLLCQIAGMTHIPNPEPGTAASDYEQTYQTIDLINESLAAFPNWYGNGKLKNTLGNISEARASALIPSAATSELPFEISIYHAFTRKITLHICRLTDAAHISRNNLAKLPHVCSVDITTDGRYGSQTREIQLDKPGRYVAYLQLDGEKDYSGYREFDVRPINTFLINGLPRATAAVVNFATGAPIKGATVSVDGSYKGRTDADGLLSFDAEKGLSTRAKHLDVNYKGISYNFNKELYVANYNPPAATDQRRMLVFTDRAIYHPGDSINFAIVSGIKKGDTESVDTDSGLTIELRDANNELVDTLGLSPDAYGRVFGSFATKKGGLTGRYSIRAMSPTETAYSSVTVSDFRAPAFEIAFTDTKKRTDGSVAISGTVTTYTGMPVANARIDVTVSGAYRWRWFSPQTELGKLQLITDSKGSFVVDMPAAMLSKDQDGTVYTDYCLAIKATSTAAETAEASTYFTTGAPYTLSADFPEQICVDKPIDTIIKATDANGETALLELEWTIVGASTSRSGMACANKAASLNLIGLPAGEYELRISAADSTLASPISTKIMAYSVSQNDVPAQVKTFMTTKTTVKLSDGKADICVGTPHSDIYLYCFVRIGDRMLPSMLKHIHKGFTTITLPINNEDINDIQIILAASRMGTVTRKNISVERPADEHIVLEASSFRDHLTPGAHEQWRFRLKKDAVTLSGAAAIATMYDHALDALCSQSWPGTFAFRDYKPSMTVYSPSSLSNLIFAHGDYKSHEQISIAWPKFTYSPESRYYYTSNRHYLGMSKMMVKEESAEYDMAAPAAARGMADSEDAAEDINGTNNSGHNKDNSLYRESELLQAFWMPTLVSDADGNIDIVFDVPNANATWQFRAFAWDKGLNCAVTDKTALANKPVMVKPNLPRFLRQGDRAQVLATVFNNSGAPAVIHTVTEIFDLESGAILHSATSTDSVATGASCLVGTDIQVPVTAAAIGYRILSRYGSFTDGEQAAIPVLSSAATVIESTEFYLDADEKTPFRFTASDKDANITLQYCQNPIWSIVKAMRGLDEASSTTSPGIVSQLFSVLSAKHIVAGSASIADAISTWKKDPTALASMLEQNEDLKKLILGQTPWIQAAKSNDTRMAALCQLLDPEKSDKAIGQFSKELLKLQNEDGGFRWADWSDKSSHWCTETVLITMGLARSLGFDISGYTDRLQAAYSYLQEKVSQPDAPAYDETFAFIASLYPDLKISGKAKKVLSGTTAHIAKTWKKASTTAKAYHIITLKVQGYLTQATEAFESLRQFAVIKAGTGMSFPSVTDIRSYATIIQAYVAMGATKAELDAMRQWICLRAQAMDDLGACNPDYVIAAVLLTGSDWTVADDKAHISIDGKLLSTKCTAGYLSVPVASGSVIDIEPNGVTPSFGSVVAISRRLASEVKARPGRDISIEKHQLVERTGKWVETDNFKTGERVRISLTIKVGRDLEYVSIDDERAGCFAPVEQLPGYIWDGSLAFYRENLDTATRCFIGFLPKGTYHISYDMTAAVAGSFSSGIATLQSQYAPELTAHSAGSFITIEPQLQ